jgi:concanavalin A-like lectin/glucanase superfamily protein
VGTYDGTTQTIYLDGQPDNTSTEQSGDIYYGPVPYGPAPYVLGRYEDDNETHHWNGGIREVLIYDGVLSASEVLDRYNATVGMFP